MKINYSSIVIPLIVLATLLFGSGYYVLSQNRNQEAGTGQQSDETKATELEDVDDDSSADESTTEETDEVPDNFVGKITMTEARSIAQARRPGKTIKKVEQEVEEGVGVYSVRFTDSGRVDVNAVTGEVMREEAGDSEE